MKEKTLDRLTNSILAGFATLAAVSVFVGIDAKYQWTPMGKKLAAWNQRVEQKRQAAYDKVVSDADSTLASHNEWVGAQVLNAKVDEFYLPVENLRTTVYAKRTDLFADIVGNERVPVSVDLHDLTRETLYRRKITYSISLDFNADGIGDATLSPLGTAQERRGFIDTVNENGTKELQFRRGHIATAKVNRDWSTSYTVFTGENEYTPDTTEIRRQLQNIRLK